MVSYGFKDHHVEGLIMTKRTIIVCCLWVLLSGGIFYSGLILVLSNNLFSWSPNYDVEGIVILLVNLVLIAGFFILAKFTQSKIEIWFSLLVALALMVVAFVFLYEFYTESISKGFFSRTRLSPHWFRLSVFLIYLTAIISWFVYPYNYLKHLLIHDKIQSMKTTE